MLDEWIYISLLNLKLVKLNFSADIITFSVILRTVSAIQPARFLLNTNTKQVFFLSLRKLVLTFERLTSDGYFAVVYSKAVTGKNGLLETQSKDDISLCSQSERGRMERTCAKHAIQIKIAGFLHRNLQVAATF